MSDSNTVTKIHGVNEQEPIEYVTGFEPSAQDPEEPKPKVIHEKNQEIWNREYIYPLLAADMKKCKKPYGDEGIEKRFTAFKKLSDPSIPYKKVVTAIVRIRTLSNQEQSLGEYIYYLANLYGYQKHFDPQTSNITIFESAHILNVPFNTDIHADISPKYINGVFKGYKDGSQRPFFTEKFIPNVSIESILESSDRMEGVNVRYSFKDMGKDYGGYTQVELSTLRADRLVSRNTKKEIGSDIKEEDKHIDLRQGVSDSSNTIEEVPKSGKSSRK